MLFPVLCACGAGGGTSAPADTTLDSSATDGAASTTDGGSGVHDDGSGTSGIMGSSDDGGVLFDLGSPCSNLECDQVECTEPGVTTRISGTILDPSGTLPLHGVQVYVPNATVAPIPETLVCDQCDAELSGSPLVLASSDVEGRFVLENAPVGVHVPLVIQVGKWRRQVVIPEVGACADNELDPELTRLPRSTREGDLPRIAVSTGQDSLPCMLRKLGLADEEFGILGSDARVHMYRGTGEDYYEPTSAYAPGFGASPGADFPRSDDTLWETGWNDYDIVMLASEFPGVPGAGAGSTTRPTIKPGQREALRDYLDAGGRVYAGQSHRQWMYGDDAPDDLRSVITWAEGAFAHGYASHILAEVDTSFPKGKALSEWITALYDEGCTYAYFVDFPEILHRPCEPNEITFGGAYTNSIVELSDDAQLWLRQTGNGDESGEYPVDAPVYVTFNAPIGGAPEEQCGRLIFNDYSLRTGPVEEVAAPFPTQCDSDPLLPQERIAIFMLLDLSACIAPDAPAG